MIEHRITLADGRTIACAEYGAPASDRILVGNHGTGSSRLEMAMYDDLLAELGLRVLGVDRPGYGESSRLPTGRVLAAWADDVAPVLDELGVGRFVVSGYSGGGPHAMAIAASAVLGPRVDRVALISSIAPDQPERSDAAREIQRRVLSTTWPDFEGSYESDIMTELANVVPADEAAFADPVFMEAAMATVGEGMKQGSLGEASDQWALFQPWGFALDAVTQPVDVWHGDADSIVPVEHAAVLAGAFPAATRHILPDEGHFSIGRHVPDIVGAALAAPAASARRSGG